MRSKRTKFTPIAVAIGMLAFLGGAGRGPGPGRDLERLDRRARGAVQPYDDDDYPYRRSVEDRIIRSLDGAYGPGAASATDALALYNDNRNGRITCAEARRHGFAPVPRSRPAYRHMRDRDGDGLVCE